MKLCELIKNGWPEKKDLPSVAGYANDITQEYPIEVEAYHNGWNYCLAAIEPIKEMEVELNREVIGDLITDLQLGLSMEEKWKIANHLAANLGKFLVIRKPYEHQ